jgi:hypothetical protein
MRRVLIVSAAGVVVVILAALAGSLMAVFGAEFRCSDGGGGLLRGGGAIPATATRAAKAEIPPARLPLYRQAGQRFDVEWAFLASIGTQECATGTCPGDSGSGCGGPMQIAFVRGTPCSPDPSAPTIWERYGMDADGDGVANVNDLADAIFTAARMMRPVFGLAGDSYADYHAAACNYYGACADASAGYAAEVMARAVRYGFRGAGTPAPAGDQPPAGDESAPTSGGSCGGSELPSGSGPVGPVHKDSGPGHLVPLPGFPGEECDSRIVSNVLYLTRRFGLVVSDCYGIEPHDPTGEHPLGAAIDAVPIDGDWSRALKAAETFGWKSSCALSGVAPECARPPFRFIGYNGFPGHGDPSHCLCGEGAHIHFSWLTSASSGQAEHRARYSYEPAKWIEVFTTDGGAESSASGGVGGSKSGKAASK